MTISHTASPPGVSHDDVPEPSRDTTAGKRRRRATPFVPRAVFAGLVPLLVVAALGAPYYILPLKDRLRSDYYDLLKPSGWVGQSAGIVAFLLFLFLWLYPLRKRLPRLRFLGPLPRWLNAHIVAGVLMPIAGAVHAGFRFTGIIGVGYMAMLVVALSGVVGRYLYLRIPRSRAGVELDREQISARRRDIVGEIVETSGIEPDRIRELLQAASPTSPAKSVLATLARLVRDDFNRRRVIRRLRREFGPRSATPLDPAKLKAVVSLARREIALAQQIRLLDATTRVFRLWHTFHLPFAITAFIAVVIHVVVAIAFGATWLG